ncbi:rho GTPase-activating protein 6-like [Echinops telfairi]|uniref:Rho GTPase-activating protein 6-like n=1 Tax=Echinops telfairi TaxID=9371 RepID=A0AC55D4D8_ECHTE|nr:rho GTPase-activating protein 6-like [Echinops telfairi]
MSGPLFLRKVEKRDGSRSPDLLQSDVSFTMGGRHSSTDSNKASSGDISPYDNNSPVLSERSLLAMQEDVAPGGSEKLYKVPEQYMLVGHLPLKSRESSPGPRPGKDMSREPFNIWGTWHSTLKSGSKDPGMTGSHGDIFESSSLRPGLCSLSQGNLSLTWSRWPGSPTEPDRGAPGLRRTQTAGGPGGPCPRSSGPAAPGGEQNSTKRGEANWLDWQRERWQIWELLSTDNPDALPETLV